MSVLDWILLALGLGTALYWYLTRHHDYWKTVGVPTLPGVLPGVGNMWDAFVFKASSSWLFSNSYKQIQKQPALGLYDFRTPSLLLGSLDLVQEVLIKEFSSFHDNSMSTVDPSLDKHLSRNPFVMKGDSWKKMRQQINPAFSPAKIKAMFPLIERVCQEFNSYIEKHANEDININQVTGLFTSEVVAKCAFGVDGNAFTAKDSGEFYQKGRKMWDSTLYSPVMMFIALNCPFVIKILRRSLVPEDVTEFFIGLVTQAEEYRIKNPDKAPEDYLQYLLNLKNKNQGFTIDDVVGQSMTFFTDGFETSSVIASFVIYELTINPDIQEAVRREVKAMESFSYDNILSLDLLDRVIKETIRKYGVFVLTKVCTKDHVLQAEGHSYPIRKGQQIILPVYAIHHDPKHYPDPERFDPDRFLPDVAKSRHPMSFLGFGGGPRMCIGNRFATSQIKVFIASTISHFRILKCSKTDEVLKLSPLQIMPVSESGLWCRFQKL